MWLNGRQIYIYALVSYMYDEDKVSQMSKGLIKRKTLIEEALNSANFMYDHGVIEQESEFKVNNNQFKYNKVYFSLNQEGLPYHFERKIFSACFLCLGLGAIASVLHQDMVNDDNHVLINTLLRRCFLLLNQIISLSRDPTPLGRADCPGALKTSPMNVPMILLNIFEELQKLDVIKLGQEYSIISTHTNSLSSSSSSTSKNEDCINIDIPSVEEWCIHEILKHVSHEKQCVFESVLPDGDTQQ